MCLPSTEQILADLQREVKRIGAKAIFVSTDKDAMLTELNGLFNGTVRFSLKIYTKVFILG
jgi:hypothetical protein